MEENERGMPVVEDNFLEAARKKGQFFKIFFMNGSSIEACIIEHDDVSIKAMYGRPMLIYKHAISRIEECK